MSAKAWAPAAIHSEVNGKVNYTYTWKYNETKCSGDGQRGKDRVRATEHATQRIILGILYVVYIPANSETASERATEIHTERWIYKEYTPNIHSMYVSDYELDGFGVNKNLIWFMYFALSFTQTKIRAYSICHMPYTNFCLSTHFVRIAGNNFFSGWSERNLRKISYQNFSF